MSKNWMQNFVYNNLRIENWLSLIKLSELREKNIQVCEKSQILIIP